MSFDKYEHNNVENKIYDYWEKNELFKPKENSKKFSIVIPPPNVTGSLHMGHALNNSIQDVLTRFHRMNNYETLWQPGTDHAGIATQALVEKKLAKDGVKKNDLGREKFIEKVWEWKNEYGDIIINQLKKLGCSCDWSRNAFTMDENLSKSVIKVFVDLYNKKLIYKAKKLVNWDVVLKTAISDLEVDQREVNSQLYYINYPIEGSDKFITIATTRPETMLGDTAIAVNPKDDRFKNLVGKFVIIPLANRKIKVITDDYADPEQGTGAVKITPAHDFNDYDVGIRNKLEVINIFTPNGKINDNAPDPYKGLDRFAARKLILEHLEEGKFLDKIEKLVNKVPYGDRSNSIIEPYLTEQWFVDAKTLAIKAKEVVNNGKTKFFPENWSKTYFQWMDNIEPWCISRQLWWGHQIPAWYGPDGKIFVAENEDECKKQAKEFYSKDVELKRDEDVLDTWFSSGLWPFATLGWPEKTPEVEKFYPTSVLVTGFDIIFFWVARMIMMGTEFLKEEPFKNIYVHALVRDEKGQKMSKSKGNVIDPLELIEKYSADALRFTLLSMASPGRDVKLSEDRVKGYRNFLNKFMPEKMENIDGGDIKSEDGTVIGKHTGFTNYTIGQRRGLGLSKPEPRYVKKINPISNTITVAKKDSMFSNVCTASQINWLLKPQSFPFKATTKIRYNSIGTSALINKHEESYTIQFDEPQLAITPGQSIVFYNDDTLLGGGIINGNHE